jgi:hypothetical protein
VLVRLRDVRADYLAGLTESRRPSLNAVMRHLHIAWLVQTEIRLRYRGWQQASDDIVRVASVLRDRLGRKELKAVVAGLERRYGDITTWSGDLSERPGVLSRVLGPLVPRRWR